MKSSIQSALIKNHPALKEYGIVLMKRGIIKKKRTRKKSCKLILKKGRIWEKVMENKLTPQALRFMKNYATCKHPVQMIGNFSHYKSFNFYEKEPFYYCANCESRWYKNRHWTPTEWDNYINETN